MKAGGQDALVLRTLAAMPFLDWLELAAVSGLAEATAYRTLRRLKAQGLVRFLLSMTRNIRPVKGEIYRVFRPADLQGL